MEKAEYYFNDYPICPYCDYENCEPDADIADGTEVEIECDACGKTFLCDVAMNRTYTTRK